MTIKYKKNNILPAIIVAIAFSDTLINATSWMFSFIVLAVFVLIAGTFVFKSSTSLTQTLKYRSAMALLQQLLFALYIEERNFVNLGAGAFCYLLCLLLICCFQQIRILKCL